MNLAIVTDASALVPALVEPELALDATERFRERLLTEYPDALFLIALDGRIAPYARLRGEPPLLRDIRERFATTRRANWSPTAAARHEARHRLRGNSADVWWVGARLAAAERRGWSQEGHVLHEFTPEWGRGVQWGVLLREIVATAEVVQ